MTVDMSDCDSLLSKSSRLLTDEKWLSVMNYINRTSFTECCTKTFRPTDVKFYAIFVSFICYLCCKAASFNKRTFYSMKTSAEISDYTARPIWV